MEVILPVISETIFKVSLSLVLHGKYVGYQFGNIANT